MALVCSMAAHLTVFKLADALTTQLAEINALHDVPLSGANEISIRVVADDLETALRVIAYSVANFIQRGVKLCTRLHSKDD